MKGKLLFVPLLLLATGAVPAEDAPKDKRDAGAAEEAQAKTEKGTEEAAGAAGQAKADNGAKLGMSILGNQEAPKSLVIVPWKSSEIGAALGISTMLDDSRQPIDKEVFMRALSYYEIRSEMTP